MPQLTDHLAIHRCKIGTEEILGGSDSRSIRHVKLPAHRAVLPGFVVANKM
jgi:hypothetical protein